MPKFNPGDPVWARVVMMDRPPSLPNAIWTGAPPGEYAAVIVTEVYRETYMIDCISLNRPGYDMLCGSHYLRPRRDDYQQHEGLGSREECDNLIRYGHKRPVEYTEEIKV